MNSGPFKAPSPSTSETCQMSLNQAVVATPLCAK
jgi:hypothetical protein